MKYSLRYLAGATIIAGSLVATPLVMAETSSNTSTDTTTTETEAETQARHDRIEKFKSDLKINLTLTQKLRLKTRCKPAQSVVAKVRNKFGNSITTRTEAYTELSKNLDKLITRLKAASVDTSTLEQEKTTLDTKIATYKTDLDTYKQALSDLKLVDCLADPTGFQAALETARTDHDTLVTDVVGIKTYVKDTIKATLMTIRTQLESSSSTDNSTGGTN